MFRNMKIGMRMALSFGLILVLFAGVNFVGTHGFDALREKTNGIASERIPLLQKVAELKLNAEHLARASRDLILTTTKEEFEGVLQQQSETRAANDKLVTSLLETATVPARKERLQEITSVLRDYRGAQGKLADLAAQGKKEEAVRWLRNEQSALQEALSGALDKYADFETMQVAADVASAEETYMTSRRLMLTGSAFAAVLALLTGVWVTLSVTRPIGRAAEAANRMAQGDLTVRIVSETRDEAGILLQSMSTLVDKLSFVVGDVRSSADTLSSASEEMAATAQSLSQASTEQAASVEETSSSVEQMTASISQNTDNSKVTDQMASNAAKEAGEGGEAVRKTVEAMKQIAQKISIIDDIAYQTNLLALNAAIEAARAGEHGKGFAVVAAEVRKLAERSQIAAQEISEVAGSSVQLAERAGKLLDEIVPAIHRTSELVQEITAASQEQSSGVSQINTAMSQLSQLTQQNASSSEELAATAEEMSGQAQQLQAAVSFFRIDGAGNTPRRAAEPRGENRLTRRQAPVPSRSHGEHLPAAAFAANEGSGQEHAAAFREPHFVRF